MAAADKILIDATKHGAHNLLVAPPSEYLAMIKPSGMKSLPRFRCHSPAGDKLGIRLQ